MADVVDTWSYGDQNTKDWLHDGDVERSAADIIDTAENVAALGEQITAAAAQAVQDVNAAGSEQMAAIEGVTASQVAIVEAAGTAQAAAVAAEGASQIAAIDGKASDVIDSIQETVQEQAMSLLEAAIEAQETAIANAGAAQVAAIDAEGAALVADAEAARDDAVSAKDAALASQAAAATAAANAAASEAAALAAADSASANASAAGVSAANAETAATQAAAAADAAMSVTDFDKYQHVNTKAWANTVDYSPGAIAKGSNGNLYVALQASGPSSTAVNPVGDASGKWERVASQSDLAAISATATQAAAAANTAQQTAESAQNAVTTLDSNVVKKSGDQTITGSINLEDSTLVAGTWPSSTKTKNVAVQDQNGVICGAIAARFASTIASIRLYIRDMADATTAWTSLPYVQFAYVKNSSSCVFGPKVDNAYNLGDSGGRWKQLYAGTTTIETSDERLKDNIAAVPDEVLDAWGDVQWGQFQFKDALAEKGEDKARLHNGLVAQRIDAVFKAHGLDASRYGLFCYDEWEEIPEEKDEQGNIVEEARPAGEIYSLRYEEALCMEATYQRRRADRAEARIAALERRLDEMEAVLASLLAPVGDETYAGNEEGEA